MVLWYNKKLLQESGITTMPADMQKEGKWTFAAFQDMCKQIVAKGKRGMIIENWWAPIYSWVTTNGGKVFDGENFVADKDEKAKEGFKFIYDNLQDKTFTYSGSLPKGQGIDAMFMSQQVGFVGAGRWLLPVFKKNASLDFDIVPWPTNTGKKIDSAGIPTAYMVQNAKAQSPDAAFAFLTDFVSKEGQTFRLTGGGNAVPSIKGADAVVSEGNLPANWQALIDSRETGYALWPSQANRSGLSDDFGKIFDALFLQGGDIDSTMKKMADAVAAKSK
jgi:multiple sugar transport system substrate-binding protein